MIKLAHTDLSVYPICLGGNVFGWTATAAESESVLDEYVANGGNFIDTADVYAAWVDGNSGGESESIIGDWMSTRRNRSDLVISTKVGTLAGNDDLTPASIRTGLEASLRRLRTDYIDLYYAHRDDQRTPIETIVSTFEDLVAQGKVRHVAASGFAADRLEEWATLSGSSPGALVAYQTKYNLVERVPFETTIGPILSKHGIAVLPFAALANGFLTGKYRAADTVVESVRAGFVVGYLKDSRNLRLLEAMGAIAAAHQTSVAAVGLAWLRQQPIVEVPLASARTSQQLREILAGARLTLADHEVAALSELTT